MKKKLLSLALVLVMALTLLPTAAFADGLEDGDPIDPPVDPCTEHVYVDGVCTNCGEEQPADILSQEKPADINNSGDIRQSNDVQQLDGGQQPTPAPGSGGTTDENQPGDTTEEVCKNATAVDVCKAETHNKTCIEACDETAGCSAEVHKPDCVSVSSGTPSGEDKTGEDQSGSGDSGSDSKEHKLLAKYEEKPATCTEPGNIAYWICQCGKYFSDAGLKTEITAASVVIPAKGHKAPSTMISTNALKHTYKCTVCGEEVSEDHDFDSNDICKVCKAEKVSTPSPYRYLDISSAYVNSYSISVTWYSDLPYGTSFDIYVDSSFRRTVTPDKSSSGYFSATVDFGYYLDESYYIVSVYAHDNDSIHDSYRAYNRYYDHDHDYWYPDRYYPNSTPSTNSYGIPDASQVNGRYSASEAIRILRNKNQSALQSDLMSSSSAMNSFDRLESAVKYANNVSVNVSVDRSDVPSPFRSGISISGAAFNASYTNSTVRLVVDAPSVNRFTGHGYQFSMTLTGVDNASSLDVPVVVSLPLPSDISASYVKVLHYHNSSVPTVITPEVSNGKIRFPLTGFSDFVVTDGGFPNYTYVSDGYGGYYVPAGSVSRWSLVDEHLAAVLPIIAATTPNGYVYDDVSGTYWAAPQIAWARDGGLMTGYFDGTFRPYSGTTRQELWMVLARLSGVNPADMWAAREWAMNIGITDGTNPHSPLSNQQMITMLYRYASYRRMNLTAPTTMLSLYHDSASVSPYARTAMAWAINQGIVTGNGTNYLYPQNIATRADFAVYLYRFLQ